MSLLRPLLDGHTAWHLDRNQETPAGFAPAEAEAEILARGAGLVDLTHLGVVRLAGADRLSLLSGLITNQLRKVTPSQASHALLLTPQGRYLWDFTILEAGDAFLLITEPDRVDDLVRRLAMYILRSKVTVSSLPGSMGVLGLAGAGAEAAVAVAFPGRESTPPGGVGDVGEGGLLWRDPRHPAFGWRLLAPVETLPGWWGRLAAVAAPVGFPAWEGHRIRHGLPRGGNEMIPDKTLPLEAGMVEMNAIDFNKGCYVGQETTARTNYRGTIKHRLFQWSLSGGGVAARGVVSTASGKEAGHVTSVASMPDGALDGIAMLRVSDALDHDLVLDGHPLMVRKPEWAAWE